MDIAKYVVIHERLTDGRGNPITDDEGFFVDREVIYVFPAMVIHREFAENLMVPKSRWRGAGFVGRQENGVHFCYGKSESMNVDSRSEDTILLKILLGEM
jgi:hypothetical protein